MSIVDEWSREDFCEALTRRMGREYPTLVSRINFEVATDILMARGHTYAAMVPRSELAELAQSEDVRRGESEHRRICKLGTRNLREFVTETDYQVTANGKTWILVLHRYSDDLLTIEHVDIKNKHTGMWLDLQSETARQVIAVFQEFTGKEPANV